MDLVEIAARRDYAVACLSAALAVSADAAAHTGDEPDPLMSNFVFHVLKATGARRQ
jgi:hypothetical protein